MRELKQKEKIYVLKKRRKISSVSSGYTPRIPRVQIMNVLICDRIWEKITQKLLPRQ